MSSVTIAARRAEDAQVRRVMRRVLALEGVLAALLVAYAIATVVQRHLGIPPPQASGITDGVEFLAALLCFARASSNVSGRPVALLFGLAISSWCLGDTVHTVLALRGAAHSTISALSLVHLAFYPLTLAAIAFFAKDRMSRPHASLVLDGAIAGLGAAAVFAMFDLHGIVHINSSDTISALTKVGYPVGDLVIFASLMTMAAISRRWWESSWLILVVAAAVTPLGNPSNLLRSYFGQTHATTIASSTAWPVTFVLMSLALWIESPPRRRQSDVLAPELALPGLAVVATLAVLLVGAARSISSPALGLATAAFAACGLRLALAVRQVAVLTNEGDQQLLIDELTGLGNRRYLTQVLDAYYHGDAGQPRTRLAFLFIDLDHFKEINDSFGHPAGDRLLAEVGPRLSSCLAESDLLVRLGGDEFAAVLKGADAGYAKAIAGRIAATLEEPFGFDRVRANISASIGIALAPTHAKDSQSLLRCADIAMYRAKTKRVPFVVYNSNLDDDGDRLRFIEELSEAVEKNLFELHYQPQLDLADGSVTAVEALIRWRHPRLGYVPPLQFLSLAEGAVLMPSLTALVLDGALVQCAQWRQQGLQVRVSVNVSATNLLDDGFTNIVKERLARYDLPPDALVLEITETSIIGNFARSRQVVEELRSIGVDTSIDDFGAGFTSLAYLGKLAVAEMKLDRTFIVPLAEGERERSLKLVRSTIELGHSLNLRVVAEGIEDEQTLDLIRSLGCDFAQGNLIGTPVPAQQIEFDKWKALAAVAALPETPVAPEPPAEPPPTTRRRGRLRVITPQPPDPEAVDSMIF
jgi:diguanylate cyclase